MKVNLPEKQEEVQKEEIKNNEVVEVKEEVKKDDELALLKEQIESLKSELKSRNEVPQPKPVDVREQEYLSTKSTVLGHVNAMSDEDFLDKYKMSKQDAKIYFLEYEKNIESDRTRQENALLRAESQLSIQYGQKYFKYKEDVAKTLDDASPEVRKDPVRLAKFMERALSGMLVDDKPEVKKPQESSRRRIVDDFERPTVSRGTEENRKVNDDEIPEEDKAVAAMMNISSAKELKELASSPYIDMDLGNGYRFSNPKTGFTQKK